MILLSLPRRLANMIDNDNECWNEPNAFMFVSDMILRKDCPNIMAQICKGTVKKFREQSKSTYRSILHEGLEFLS